MGLLSCPVEILHKITRDNTLSMSDRCNIRLAHPALRDVIDMWPYITFLITFPNREAWTRPRRTTHQKLNALLSDEKSAARLNIKTLQIILKDTNTSGLATFAQSSFNQLVQGSRISDLSLEMDEGMFNHGKPTAASSQIRCAQIGSLIEEICSSNIQRISMSLTLLHEASFLIDLSRLSCLDLSLQRYSGPESAKSLCLSIGEVIRRSPALKDLTLTSPYGSTPLSLEDILNVVPLVPELHLHRLKVNSVLTNISSKNVPKLQGLRDLRVSVLENGEAEAAQSAGSLPRIWSGFEGTSTKPRLNRVTMPGLPDRCFGSHLDATFGYLRSSSASTITRLKIEFKYARRNSWEYIRDEQLQNAADTAKTFWFDVFPEIRDTIQHLKLSIDQDDWVRVSSFQSREARCTLMPSVLRHFLPDIGPLSSPSLLSLNLPGLYEDNIVQNTMLSLRHCPRLCDAKFCLVVPPGPGPWRPRPETNFDNEIDHWEQADNWSSAELKIMIIVRTYEGYYPKGSSTSRTLQLVGVENGKHKFEVISATKPLKLY